MKISIITVVFNNKANITDCIESVLGQSYKNIEYIIIDGQSNDGTLDIINRYKDNISVVISEKDKGMYDALNKGFKIATGEVIGILHSDDLFFDNQVIEKVAAVFQNVNINALHGDLIYVQKEQSDKIVRFWKSSEFTFKKLTNGWMPPHPTLFLKSELVKNIGTFNLEYKIAADYDFMLRVFSSSNINSYYLPQVITKMRLGGASNKSIKNIIRKSYEDYLILRRNNIGGFRSLFFKNFNKINQFFSK